MKRRTFLKAAGGIASALLLPATEHVNGIDCSLVKRFCGDSGRYDLTEPFVQTTSCYATDGRVALHLYDSQKYAGESAGKLPDADEVFERQWTSGSWQPWPTSEYVRKEDRDGGVCPDCGFDFVECKRCLGNGFLLGPDPRMDVKPCPNKHCDEGVIRVTCKRCLSGETYHYQRIDGRIIRPDYHCLVSTLPSVEFIAGTGDDNPVSFRFDGGRGLLMPMASTVVA